MDKRVLRERMRRKKRQMMIRRYTKMGVYAVAAILSVIFVVRGIIIPVVSRVGGGGEEGNTVKVQAQTSAADPNAAIRQPLKGQQDVGKVTAMTPGWHEDETGRWYQNADGTYFSSGFQEIGGNTYAFDDNGYLQTGWVEKGVREYYFNDDGSYNPEKKRTLLALTFDDGPGQYTDQLLDCLEENGAKATFFMQGQYVGLYPDTVKRMKEIGCELGSHSWDHPDLTTLSLEQVKKQFDDTDNALIQAAGQPASVARAPFGAAGQEIYDTVNKPFMFWSLDTMDWDLKDADLDYDAVMNGDLTDGSIILMHDIHQPSVEAALRIIPDLIAKGYKLVTVSELAEAKGVTLQNARYISFWDSALASGEVVGYNGGEDQLVSAGGEDNFDDGDYSDEDYSDEDYSDEEDFSDDSEEMTDGSEEFSDESSDEEFYDDEEYYDEEDYSDGSGDY